MLVVGAGISGALVAEALSDAALEVVVVDRRAPVHGSTPASTCLMQSDLDTPLTELGARVGVARAARIWSRTRLALDALEQRCEALGLDAELAVRDSLYLAGNVLDADGLEREAKARRRAGIEVDLLGRAELKHRYRLHRSAALVSHHQLSADPVRLTHGLLAAAQARGARIFSPVELSSIAPHRAGVTALTRAGPRISARHLVYATGYELPRGVPAAKHSIASTWAVATRPQPRALWPTQALIWEAADPYLYCRTTPDGRIICGGLDEAFSDEAARDALLEKKTAQLERALARLWPECDPRAAFAWTGSFGTSTTGTPSIGRVPRLPNCYAVLGYGGNGITFSMLAAQLLRGLILGDGDADAALFAFGA
ncbi:MAG: FAD-binding oxidoreductase [Archangiaceae bacterium]|nr:FAD-binding oxidoreductase [Archangiaceae bacterium]